jgi:hypothetical protein
VSWAKIKTALNATLGRKDFKSLDRVASDEAYQAFYNTVDVLYTMLGSGADYFLTIRDNRTEISDNEWEMDGNVMIAVLPTSIKRIGQSAFYGCEALRKIYVPNTVNEIDSSAFARCTALETFSFPQSASKISFQTFAECSSVANVHIPEGLREIQFQAFANCTNLSKIRIPASVTTIDARAFEGCTALHDIYVGFSEGVVPGAPWGASYATIHYNS